MDNSTDTRPKSLTAIIDRIERLREELLMVQRSLENMEGGEPSSDNDETLSS